MSINSKIVLPGVIRCTSMRVGSNIFSSLSFYFWRKKFLKKERKAETAAAIPFPLKPLFLAAVAGVDLLIFTDF